MKPRECPVCEECGSDVTNASLSRYNKLKMLELKRIVLGE